MDRAAMMGLLLLYKKGRVGYHELRREINHHAVYTGQDMAIIRELESKGYVLKDPDNNYSINPVFDSFKADFGISLSGSLGRRTGVYTNPVFISRSMKRDPNLCFVLMPFREPFQALYEDHISKVVTKLGLTCRKADELFGPREIMEDIWELIYSARLLLADLTDRNPNVFTKLALLIRLEDK